MLINNQRIKLISKIITSESDNFLTPIINWLLDKLDIKYSYDSNGNMLTYLNAIGFWVINDYTKEGKSLHTTNSSGFWATWKYDDNGNFIEYVNSAGIVSNNYRYT